ncbi:MAG: hypothetical protein P4M00_20175 [Azospirillaceae bacterium]|nr:hypothetical protein [Azospirillaceae bacterium]
MPLISKRCRLPRGGADIVFFALLMLCLFLIFDHAMWLDEIQAWEIAAASANPLALFHNMSNEGHPPLWHLVLWLVTRMTEDLRALALLQAVITIGIFTTIWRLSSLAVYEKLLLLSSYYILFEYGVLARTYGLGVLLLFGAVHSYLRHQDRPLLYWLCLGLAANTVAHITLVSLALALGFLVEQRHALRRQILPAGLYAVLVALAVVWAIPAADTWFGGGVYDKWTFVWDPEHFVAALDELASAFLPLTKSIDHFSNPLYYPLVASHIDASLDVVAPIAAVVVYALCLIALGERRAMAIFVMASGAVFLFLYAKMLGYARHYGIIFIAFILCLWLARARQATVTRLSRAATAVLLLVGAVGGIDATLGALRRPFDQARNAATFIRYNYPEDVFLAGGEFHYAFSVSGFLAHPMYYPECQCQEQFIRWNRQHEMLAFTTPDSPFWPRLAIAMMARARDQGVLVLTESVDVAALTRRWPGFSLVERARYVPQTVPTGGYRVYDIAVDPTRIGYQPGTPLAMGTDPASIWAYRGDGWCAPESWGIWSCARQASLTFLLTRTPQSGMTVQLHLVHLGDKPQEVTIVANGVNVGTVVVTDDRFYSVAIPRDVAAASPLLQINLDVARTVTPKSLGLGEDIRTLGIGMRTARLDPG